MPGLTPTGEDPAAIEARVQAQYEAERFKQDFERSVSEFAADVQAKLLPAHVPDGYAEAALREMDRRDPSVGLAWYAIRANVDPNRCRMELDNVRRALATINPEAPGAAVYGDGASNRVPVPICPTAAAGIAASSTAIAAVVALRTATSLHPVRRVDWPIRLNRTRCSSLSES
jgi:hypothetical protein